MMLGMERIFQGHLSASFQWLFGFHHLHLIDTVRASAALLAVWKDHNFSRSPAPE